MRALIWETKRRFMSSSALFAAMSAYERHVTVMRNMPMTVTSSMSVKPLSSLRSRRRSRRTDISVSGDAERGETVVLGRSGRRDRADRSFDLAGRDLLRQDELLGAVERDLEVVSVRRRIRRHVPLHEPVEDEADQRLRERLHVEELAVLDRVGDLVGTALADELGGPRVGHHHLDRRHAPSADARQEPLADDSPEHAREDRHDLRLLLRREELDHAADRLGGVECVQGREDEMPGFGCLQRGLRRLGVAKLPDQDDVRVLTKDAAQRLREALGVETDLTLVDDAAVVGMEQDRKSTRLN